MSLENTRYIELTFINDLAEVKKQIKNTLLFLYLAEKYGVSLLSDYLEGTQYGFTASAKAEGSVKLLRITDITEGKVDWDSVPYCDCDKPTKYLLKQDDILVARTGGTTGKSFIVKDVPSNVVYASYLIRLRLKKESNPEFISSFFNSYTYWSQLVELKRGAAQPNVNAEKLKKIVIPKCSPNVQDSYVSYLNGDFNDKLLDSRISKILSLFDNNQSLKAEQIHQILLLKKMRQQILQDAIQGKLVLQNPDDEPADKLVNRIKEKKEVLIKKKRLKIGKSTGQSISLIKEVPKPETWTWCKSEDIFFITKLAGFEYTEHISLKSNGEIPVVRAQNVRPLNIDKKNLLFIDKQTSLLLDRCSLTKKCLLVTFIGAGIGDVATFNEKERWHLAPNVAKIEPLEDCENLINIKYVNYFLMSPLGQKEIFKHIKATAQPSLSMGTIRDIDILIPPLNEQNRIVNKIEQLMKLSDELEQSIQENQKLAQELLKVVLKEALS